MLMTAVHSSATEKKKYVENFGEIINFKKQRGMLRRRVQ